MDLNSIIGLLQDQDLQALTSKLGGDESQVKSGLGSALPAWMRFLEQIWNGSAENPKKRQDFRSDRVICMR